jgi:uncharacterized protein YoxC
LLLQAASESIGASQATAGGGLLETLAVVAIAIIALLLIALLLLLIPTVRSLRRATEKMEDVLGRVSREMDPVVRHATNIADNADYISTAVRADVGQLSLTVRRANDAVNGVLDDSERRVKELGALLRVFQNEVEQTLVSATSILRGVRAGAEALRDGADDFLDELDDDEEESDDLMDEPDEFLESGTILDLDDEANQEIEDTLVEGEEMEDGYDWKRDGGDGGDDLEERPRIRRRPAR